MSFARRHIGDSHLRPGRPEDDFFPTPPATTRALLSVERFHGPIWEPACGDGALAEVLRAAGHVVLTSDLHDRGYGRSGLDFLRARVAPAPNIVTNPPYRLALAWIEQTARLVARKAALLMPLRYLEGGTRTRILEGSPLARVWVFRGRQKLGRRGATFRNGGVIALAWYVWEAGHAGRPEVGWL